MEERIEEAARIICSSRLTLALTGAGISVESGIPDFRGAGGLWDKYNPAEYATIHAFRSNPKKVWAMLREMDTLVQQAKPNKAHIGLADLERMGLLHCVITQNVDNLHQAGGSAHVIEYHGNSSTLSCLQCGYRVPSEERRGETAPRCSCGMILKPDVVFFGESIPPDALSRSFEMAAGAQALLVVGTSAVVSPANTIPVVAKRNGARIIEVNKESTHLTQTMTDVFLQGSSGEIIPALVEKVKTIQGGGVSGGT
ncbi:MAG: NAD-dependent deacylase [Deltaproteobacteria bacterium]|nr:NAD-dependent deacylase [Deltaproteobacteria bacterium]